MVHHAALGDTVLLIPLLRSLRARFGAPANLTLVTRPAFGKLLQRLGHADAWASAEEQTHSAWFGANVENVMPAWADTELLLSAVSNGNDAWAAHARRLSSAPIHFFDPRPPPAYRRHVTQWHREQLAMLELPEPRLPPLRANAEGTVLIHPGSGGDAKCWPLANFLTLGETMRAQGMTPTFVTGEVERERWGDTVLHRIGERFPLVREETLADLAGRLAPARLYVGNDSGVTHLAAAMGISVIALFGASNEVQWRPVGPQVTVLRGENGMNGLGVARVADAVVRTLQRTR